LLKTDAKMNIQTDKEGQGNVSQRMQWLITFGCNVIQTLTHPDIYARLINSGCRQCTTAPGHFFDLNFKVLPKGRSVELKVGTTTKTDQ